jgi:hypothetical protein
MFASFRSRWKNWVLLTVAAWMITGNPALRRQILGTASTVTRAIYQTVAQRLDREAQEFDRERAVEETRLASLRSRLATVTSESERLALAREIRDGEARLIAAQADLGQIVRQAHVVVDTGDQIGESWRVARGYTGATRDALVAQVQQGREETARLSTTTSCQASELANLKQVHAATAAELLAAAELLREARLKLQAEGSQTAAPAPQNQPSTVSR